MCPDQCPWGGPRAVAAALGVVGSVTQPPRPLPDPLRVGGEADIVRTPVVLNHGLLGNQKRQSLVGGEATKNAIAEMSKRRCQQGVFSAPDSGPTNVPAWSLSWMQTDWNWPSKVVEEQETSPRLR